MHPKFRLHQKWKQIKKGGLIKEICSNKTICKVNLENLNYILSRLYISKAETSEKIFFYLVPGVIANKTNIELHDIR